MESLETQRQLIDANGKEIKVGSLGRLSEEGREQAMLQVPKMLIESANLRFKVIDLNVESQKAFVELTEVNTIFKVVLDSRFIIIEN